MTCSSCAFCIVVIIGLAVFNNCSQHLNNSTQDVKLLTEQPTTEQRREQCGSSCSQNDFDLDDQNWWCPDGYHLREDFRVCLQKSCLRIKPEEVQKINSTFDNKVTVDDQDLACVLPDEDYNACWKVPLDRDQYEVVQNNASIRIRRSNTIVPIGKFVILASGTASVCSDKVTTSTPASSSRSPKDFLDDMSSKCVPFQVPTKNLTILTDGTASIQMNDKKYSLKPHFYQVMANNSNICYELATFFTSCTPKGILPDTEFELLPSMDVSVPLEHPLEGEIIHPLGTYMLQNDETGMVYCITNPEPPEDKERTYLYGTAYAASAVALFFSLLAHFLYPSLSCHAKALFCHIISMFVLYLSFSLRFFHVFPELNVTLCYVRFAITYVCSLGAFFWLSVLAFDLWRIFARMRVSTTPGSKNRKKKKFIFQCLYAWGIPTVLCVIALAIDNNVDFQKSIDFKMDLTRVCWFYPQKPMFLLFYAPILIILVSNSIFFVLTIYKFQKACSGTEMVNKKVNQQLLKVSLKLFVVMGLCWFTDIASWFIGGCDRWHYTTDLINGLQGVAIFFVYTFKKSTWTLIKDKFSIGAVSHAINSVPSTTSKSPVRKMSDTTVYVIPETNSSVREKSVDPSPS